MNQDTAATRVTPLDPSNPATGGADEAARLAALARTGLLDSGDEQAFDDIVELARLVCGAPVASVTLVDRDRQWFKAERGLGTRETPRSESLCSVAIRDPGELLEVGDVQADATLPMRPRDADGAPLRFYAGMPVLSTDGHALGTICVLDHAPRALDDDQRAALRALARQVERLVELRAYAARRDSEARSMARDRADLQRRHDDLKRIANRDPLTGLRNRAALEQMRHRDDALAHLRAGGYVVAVVDIDHFKQVNDRHGHLVGDHALKVVADVLAASVRATDAAFRYGGEEFLLVLPRTSLADAYVVAERIRLDVMRRDLPFALTVSIGLAAGNPAADQPEQVFERADQALYRAKASGRNRVVADESFLA